MYPTFLFCFTAIKHESASRAGRVLVVTWLLLSVMLASVYSSQLTSSLTVGQQAPPFTSLAQLLRQDAYTWGVASGTAHESALKVGALRVRFEGRRS